MDPLTLGLVAAATLVVLGGGKKKGRKTYAKQEFKGDREEVRQWVYSQAKAYSKKYDVFPGLEDFLMGVGYRESRFTPTAQNGTERNSARGLFQMRPDSAFRSTNGLTHLRDKPELLLKKEMAMVAAIDYIARATERSKQEGIPIDYMAIRRWWALPKLLWDSDLESSRSQSIEANFPEDVGKGGGDPNVVDRMVTITNYPGIEETAKFFGVKL